MTKPGRGNVYPVGHIDVAVVGGGPGGLMAAEVLATHGLAVTVFDRMPSVARKFVLAGRGGLNITHSEPVDDLLGRYGPARDRLSPAVAHFGPDALREWCAGLGQEPFVGTSGRVFPAGFRATPLLRAWLGRLALLGVELRTRHSWTGWGADGALTFVDGGGSLLEVDARATVLALGGASRPRVGSDGAWVELLRVADVEVTPLRAANCGFTTPWTEPFATRFAGTAVKSVGLAHGGRSTRGDALVTRTGIEGGPVYALAPALRESIEADGSAVMTADLRPDRTVPQLIARLARGRPGDSASTMLRRAWGLAPVGVGLLREATGNRLPDGPEELATLAKAVPVRLTATCPLAEAISTAGGVAFAEVDEAFMLRRRPGVFVAGEMLDWEAPTGGYLLQATFSTAVAAAHGVIDWLGRS